MKERKQQEETHQKILSPQEAKEKSANENDNFSSNTARRVFDRIAKATEKSKGNPIEVDVTGRSTSLRELVTKDDEQFIASTFGSKGWKVRMNFYEGPEDPGHYAPGHRNDLIIYIEPKKSSKK